MGRTVVWFRRDLRIEDNPSLAAAMDGSVLPVYIWCPREEGQFHPGRVSRWWLKQSLFHLDLSLKSLGAGLVLIKAESTLDALLHCINAIGATKVVFSNLYDPVSLVRDHNIKKKLMELGISVQSYNGDLLYEPWEIHDEKGQAFTNFDTYWDKCLTMQLEPVLLLPPRGLVPSIVIGTIEKVDVEDLGLEDESEKSSNALLGRAWSPGWSNAAKALFDFTEEHLLDYSKNRLKVDGNSSSLLSPHLHFGELSVKKVFHCVQMKRILWRKDGISHGEECVNLFLRAIGLREYSRYLCFNFPFTLERPLMSNLRYFPWDPDQARFKAWRQGRTGYPLVDAGMRELWATGWNHNRIRVIVASFSVKFLLLPWKWGMKYFWDTLLDADLESDILGWQYISGSLPDGHELDRMDCPEVQGLRFDPDGHYVRLWLPELARLPTEWIHHPWDAPLTVLKASGVELGLNYPMPIVDINSARDHLTKAIFTMWEMDADARVAGSDASNEEVVDNSFTDASSHDQRVPMTQYEERGRKKPRNVNVDDDGTAGSARTEANPCSTAESSSAKSAAMDSSSVHEAGEGN